VVCGTVKAWNDDEGWGVLASPEVPDDVWAHFTAIEVEGYRTLQTGTTIEFDYIGTDQDGYTYRATRVVTADS
jgi:cold shock protein